MKIKELTEIGEETRARFWNLVDVRDPDSCWPWTGYSTNGIGSGRYGRFRINGTWYRANRVSYILKHGPFPPGKNFACHRCDNPICVNPGHIFAGSPKDNVDDMMTKGRMGSRTARSGYSSPIGPRLPNSGETHRAARLTGAQVLDIRRLHSSGESQRALARRFLVSRPTISMIIRGETWRGLL